MNPSTLPVGQLKDGNNYRRRFDPIKMQELVDDIKRHNLLTPVTVRLMEDGEYHLIAGRRRVRAFKAVHGDEAQIPVYVRVMTDAEAMAAMVSENKQREDTSAIEDAEAATRMLGLMKGDKAETAKRLGWSTNMLDRRLALMNATDGVRDAYIDDKLKLGHVEILAAMRREVQDNILVKMLAQPNVPTVEQLKAMAEQVLLGLDAAIFDKTDCKGCQFNTGIQQAMFETSFSGSRCTNGECYNKKTEGELEVRKQSLTETYQVVRIVRPGENLTLIALRAEGPKGVGDEQAKACRTCGDFGACVSAAPDKLGMTFKEVCFNAECHSDKVKERIKVENALAEASEKAAKALEGGAETGETDVESQDGASGPTEDSEPSAPSTGTTKAKAASSEPRNVVREYRSEIWRIVFQRAALKLPVEQSRALLIALCLLRPSTMDNTGAIKAVGKVIQNEKLSSTDAFKLTSEILKLDQPQLGASLQQIPAFISTQMDINSIVGFLKALDIKLEHHWKINSTFLDLLTKTEIDAVCTEVGIENAIGKDYNKMKNGSKADFIKAILAVKGFEFAGKIPKLMRW